MTFRVDVASMGRMSLPGPEVFWMAGWDEWFNANFWMVVGRSADHTVVVNTGPPHDITELNGLWKQFHPSGECQFTRDRSQEPAEALARLGVDPAEVTHVVLSPTVVYTLGNLRLFPNAEFVLSRRGWIEDVLAPPYQPHLPRHIFVPDDVLSFLLFEARDRVRLVDTGDIVPGLSVWPALVHHRSSLAVCFDTEKGSVIATDAAFSYRNVEDNIHLGIGESYAEAMVTYERLRAEADILIPLYEPAVLERHPDGHIA
jgi:glyoxylase-like metal-dependent hydrolase (beta-lactamase superfamily II)